MASSLTSCVLPPRFYLGHSTVYRVLPTYVVSRPLEVESRERPRIRSSLWSATRHYELW
jgi:hypothetical protein